MLFERPNINFALLHLSPPSQDPDATILAIFLYVIFLVFAHPNGRYAACPADHTGSGAQRPCTRYIPSLEAFLSVSKDALGSR